MTRTQALADIASAARTSVVGKRPIATGLVAASRSRTALGSGRRCSSLCACSNATNIHRPECGPSQASAPRPPRTDVHLSTSSVSAPGFNERPSHAAF
jgi:hypothetical protein